MSIVNNLLPKIEHLGLLAYWVVLAVAFLESLAFVGLLIPGTVILLFVGFLTAEGILDFYDVMWFAFAGAVLGDIFSYYLGQKGRFFKSNYLAAGEQFLKQYGNQSIFFGRFVGPVRPVIAIAAGYFKMRFRDFMIWNILSAAAWVVLYVTLGHFFGEALSVIGIWSERAGAAITALLAIAVFLYFWRIRIKLWK